MKKILFIAAMLSFLAFNSCQDNTTPEGSTGNDIENSTDDGTEDGTDDGPEDGTDNGTEDGTENGTGDETVVTGGTYTVGDQSGELTLAFFENNGDADSDNSTRFILYFFCDVLDLYNPKPPYGVFGFELKFPELGLTEIQPGTYTVGSPELLSCSYSYIESSSSPTLIFVFTSVTVEISKTGEAYTITFTGTLDNGSAVSATYTGPITEY